MIFFKKIKNAWNFLERQKKDAKDWFIARAHGLHAKAWLALISFSEASFFIIPPEVLYLPMILAGASRWMYYAFITTAFSLLGGVFGYLIGAFLFDIVGEFIISTYNLEAQMLHISELFRENAFWTIFTAAFTPIPYKVFTISAGFFSINFLTFIIASILGRSARYFALGYVFKRYNKTLGNLIFKYFNILSVILIIVIFLFIVFVKAI